MAQLDAAAEREALEVSVFVVWGNDAFILGWFLAPCVAPSPCHSWKEAGALLFLECNMTHSRAKKNTGFPKGSLKT